MKNPQETKIVNLALNNLEAVTGIHGEWEFLEHTENTGIVGIPTITLDETRINLIRTKERSAPYANRTNYRSTYYE